MSESMRSANALSFVGMWALMMAAMMLPSLVPALWRHRLAVRELGGTQPGALSALVGGGYFFVWILIGAAAYPLSIALAALSRAAPMSTGVVVVLSGALQLSAWKAHHLACCRGETDHSCVRRAGARAAWRHGLQLGMHCGYCCAGITAILLVAGDMSFGVMALATAAITLERVAPAGMRVTRAIGAAVVCSGLILIARSV